MRHETGDSGFVAIIGSSSRAQEFYELRDATGALRECRIYNQDHRRNENG
jgi:hypothetical protein